VLVEARSVQVNLAKAAKAEERIEHGRAPGGTAHACAYGFGMLSYNWRHGHAIVRHDDA